MTQSENVATAQQLFLESLRAETTPSHKKLDSLPVSAVLMTPELTKQSYLTYLEKMYPVIKWAEDVAYGKLPENISLPGNFLRHTLLRNDIEFLGGNAADTDAPFVLIDSPAAAFGVAYVIEGSSLGGVYIAKNVKNHLGYDENGGLSFLIGNGKTTGSTWKLFLEQLTSFAVEKQKEQEVIASASAMFESIHNHLSASA
ncbi:MAG: hypothetical protein EOO01_06075 [Chitinophagaceae bacterium]|nr:MAG: hypothetical protein EOO01_06075 [Chitinophagaceae bacterium]